MVFMVMKPLSTSVHYTPLLSGLYCSLLHASPDSLDTAIERTAKRNYFSVDNVLRGRGFRLVEEAGSLHASVHTILRGEQRMCLGRNEF